jgi:hypothetical protein
MAEFLVFKIQLQVENPSHPTPAATLVADAGGQWPHGRGEPARETEPTKTRLRARSDGEHLAALVKATRGTDAVRHIGRIALRALAQLGELKNAVISPALVLPAG